ncbi:MAG: type I-MYXAN CRISPR-associated endonuclease Cas1 [Thermosynechococcus sp.]
MEQTVASAETETLRVSSLHAFAYCQRLFYLEEVEELYTQNESVFAGRRLHAELQKLEREDWQEFNLESVALGLRGRVDALRTLEGHLIPYEHKIGRCYRDRQQQPQAWHSDRVQILAYACLLETVLGVTVPEGRIHYHRDNVTVRVPVDEAGRQLVRDTIEQARQLRASLERPPVCSNERLCLNCSLAPVCLPEEARLARDPERLPLRLFPRDDEREIIHVTVDRAVIKRAGQQLRIAIDDEPEQKLPAKLLVNCRGQSQRRLLLRRQRNHQDALPALQEITTQMEQLLNDISHADSLEALRGIEGSLAALYFSGLPYLLGDQVPKELRFNGRNRRPPRDRFNALLSFGYSLLLKDLMNAILTVGLEPALGFYHQPRTQAPPLALDLMEIFRVPLVDMVVIGSINRMQWNLDECFEVRRDHVWLSDDGRRKFIELYEARKGETWKHPVTNYSLTYRRLLELEVRLLEKEWCGEAGLFGKLILR